jgi:hypothetical protein
MALRVHVAPAANRRGGCVGLFIGGIGAAALVGEYFIRYQGGQPPEG